MSDTLDNATDRARANAALRRRRIITWEEQEAFFERHWQDFGDDYEMVMRRLRQGHGRYRDDAFWYSLDEVREMRAEERCDEKVYGCIEDHRDEVERMRRGER